MSTWSLTTAMSPLLLLIIWLQRQRNGLPVLISVMLSTCSTRRSRNAGQIWMPRRQLMCWNGSIGACALHNTRRLSLIMTSIIHWLVDRCFRTSSFCANKPSTVRVTWRELWRISRLLYREVPARPTTMRKKLPSMFASRSMKMHWKV